ncbi:MAG: DUF302 domain-containing protein [Steroidobacteraceae bacterium]
MRNEYGFGIVVNLPFAVAIESLTAALQTEGFGVLTDIDVAATFKKKLDKEMPPYRIIGACNPSLAATALDSEPSIGLLLPCNVVVREDDHQQVHIEFMDPIALMNLVGKPEIDLLAETVRGKLQRVMQSLTPSPLSRSA